MGEECKSGSCGCGESNCGCGENNCSCGKEQCDCSKESCCEGKYSKMDMFMWLAHSAKMELVKEKMKKKIESVKGKQLDQVADLFVAAMMEKYKNDAESEKRREELQQKFDEIFDKE